MLEGLAWASNVDADAILATELGTTKNTKHLTGARYASDWGTGQQARYGEAVGAFIDRRWENHWIQMPVNGAPSNSRFYLIATEHVRLIIGVFYAPHAGKGTDLRLRFYRKLWSAWVTIRQRFPIFWVTIGGDANIPELFNDDVNGVRSIAPKGQVARFFNVTFLSNLKLTNVHSGVILPTHQRNSTLDLILCDTAILVPFHRVSNHGVGGSDHRMVASGLAVPGLSRPPPTIGWSPAKQVDWQHVIDKLQEPLLAWHAWVTVRIQGSNDVHVNMRILKAADALLTCIVLYTIWRRDSECGRFCETDRCHLIVPWWSNACQTALSNLGASRGCPGHTQAKKTFRSTILKARQSSWVEKIEELEKAAPRLQPDLHRHIRAFLHPQVGVNQVLKAGNAVVAGTHALDLLAAHFEAQSSYEGPRPVETLITNLPRVDASSQPGAHRLSEDPIDENWEPSSGGSTWSSGDSNRGCDSDSDEPDTVAQDAADLRPNSH